MAWVTWRQHRMQLLIGLALLGVIGLVAAATGLRHPLRVRAAGARRRACRPPTRSGCDIIVRHFQSEYAR